MQTHAGQESGECPQTLELIAAVFFELSCKQRKCYIQTDVYTYGRTDGIARHYIPASSTGGGG